MGVYLDQKENGEKAIFLRNAQGVFLANSGRYLGGVYFRLRRRVIKEVSGIKALFALFRRRTVCYSTDLGCI